MRHTALLINHCRPNWFRPVRRAPSVSIRILAEILMLTIDTARVFEPFKAPSRYKGAWGGRGSGKSHYMAGAIVEYCLLHPGAR